jgi:anaerobic dimethyl sulfoxide reductase subunit B
MRYAFTFDASACTGCKTCQVACKDQNGLPLGMLWRRVYEVSGGTWDRRGAAWTNTVFAYNMSIACNHCEDPACVAACPTGACTVRDDGIVWIDEGRCAGCEYCAWACPYSVPQYARDTGRMTKCDFCRDLVDEGLPPACVSSCPMRALGITEVAHDRPLPSGGPRALWEAPASEHPYPLPPFSRTRPQLALTPHAAMTNALPKAVANREEVRPPGARAARTAEGLHRAELPLVAFTLLAQAAAGAAVIGPFTGAPASPLLALTGILAALAALVSLLHLGQASRAWRATANVATSALSREVLALGLFGAAWLAAWRGWPGARAALALAGIALVYLMAEVYAIDGVPGWNRWRTRATFAASTLLLGTVAALAVARPLPVWLIAAIAGAVVTDQFLRRWRFYERRQQQVM